MNENEPFPPRFRQLKRLTLLGVCLLIALVGLRIWWGYEVDRRERAFIAEIKAKGEPILAEDFVQKPIPDAENAAVLIRQAQNMLRWGTIERNAYDADTPYSEADYQRIGTLKTTHAAELRLLRQARGRQAVWVEPLPRMTTLSGNFLTPARHLALLVKWIALYEHRRGNDREMIELGRDVISLGTATMNRQPTLINSLVSQGVVALGTNLILDHAVEIDIARNDEVEQSKATESQLRALIVELLDEEQFRKLAAINYLGDCMMELNMSESDYRAMGIPHPWYIILEPHLHSQRLRESQAFSQGTVGLTADSFPAAESLLSPELDLGKSVSLLQAFIRQTEYSGPRNSLAIYFKIIAERRLAATLLAVRLYERNYDGQIPKTLEQLVPDYLPAVPCDPFSPGNHPLSYLPLRDPPAVYSYGENEKDDGGSQQGPLQSDPIITDNPWGARDAVYPVRMAAPATRPTTRPAGNSSN